MNILMTASPSMALLRDKESHKGICWPETQRVATQRIASFIQLIGPDKALRSRLPVFQSGIPIIPFERTQP